MQTRYQCACHLYVEWQDYRLPRVPFSAPLSSFSTFTLSHSRPVWIWAVKRSSRHVWLAHFVESLNIQGGLSFEAAPGSPFVSEAALFILTYVKWSLTWSKSQKNTSEVLSPTSFRFYFILLKQWMNMSVFNIILWFVLLPNFFFVLFIFYILSWRCPVFRREQPVAHKINALDDFAKTVHPAVSHISLCFCSWCSFCCAVQSYGF